MDLDCACCGIAIEISTPVSEDSEHVCPECGATCVLFFGDDTSDADPYFGSWRCEHGISGDEPCDACEIEHGVAV